MTDEDTRLYYNRTDTAITVDSDGHFIEGLSHGEFPESPQIRRAINSGDLCEVEKPKEDVGESDQNADDVSEEPVKETPVKTTTKKR